MIISAHKQPKAIRTSRLESTIQALLQMAGITLNGSNPWDIQVNDSRFYQRVLTDHSLGLGESYMEGWWDVAMLDSCIFRLLRAGLNQKLRQNAKLLLRVLMAHIFNLQTKKRSLAVANVHYNLDNTLYEYMLGPTMAYTCGYWARADNLDAAQDAKHELVCRKLKLKAGDRVLELGCGWGGFAEYAAKHYGCHLVCVNIAKEQVTYARKRCEGLPVTFYLGDYRNVKEYNPGCLPFDKVVSIGMCEHVGHKNYRHFMEIAYQQLKPEGLFLLHTIGGNRVTNAIEPWHGKYIFPNGMLPAIQQLAEAAEGLFIMEDWHNFGLDYDKTLMAWHQNFVTHWPQLKARYDDRFYRMWTFYLLSCAGMFRARSSQLWQIVFSKDGCLQPYRSLR